MAVFSNEKKSDDDKPKVEKATPRFRGRFAGVKDLDELEDGGFDGTGNRSKLFMMARKPEAESDASDDEKEVQEIDLKNVDELAPEIANLFIKKAPVLAAEKQEEEDAEEAPE